MRITKCDRCGKEVPQKNWVEYPIFSIEIWNEPIIGTKKVDLCDECKKDFLEWLKGGNE